MTHWTATELQKADWFHELVARIRQALERQGTEDPAAEALAQQQAEDLRKQVQGWMMSLGKGDLNLAVREALEASVNQAMLQIRSLERRGAELDALRQRAVGLVDAAQAADRLNRLADILSAASPSRSNLELSLHVDFIRCHENGQVVLRTCKLGALAGAVPLLASPNTGGPANSAASSGVQQATPRRRAVRRIDDGTPPGELRYDAHTAADVQRFKGLAPEWFWEDEFTIPEPTFWAKEHAVEVAALRAQGLTHEELAEHFGVTVPTIRKALKIAAAADPSLTALPRKMPRRRWEDAHALEVARARAAGMKMKELTAHFGKSEPTIRKALRIAEELNKTPPDTSTGRT